MAHWAHDRVNVIVHTANSAPCNRKDGMTFTQKKKKKEKKRKKKKKRRRREECPSRSHQEEILRVNREHMNVEFVSCGTVTWAHVGYMFSLCDTYCFRADIIYNAVVDVS